MARGVDCKAHRHDSLVAQERHHLQPLSRGGPNKPDNLRYLCANAHGDAHYLLDHIEDQAALMMRRGGPVLPGDPYTALPWALKRTFGPGVRDVALTGWNRYAGRFLAGEFLAHRMLWSTSGAPRDTGRHYGELPYSIAVAQRCVAEMLDAAAERYGISRP